MGNHRDKIILSIVIPVYQVEKYLERCVDSVLNQKFDSYEIILVDDGSFDESPQICDNYVQQYSNIVVIHKSNGGLSDARNVGIKHSRGEYVFFPDSDDWIMPTMFEDLSDDIFSERYDVIEVGRQICLSKSDQPNVDFSKNNRMVFTGLDAFKNMLQNDIVTSFANDKIIRKSIFQNNYIEFPKGAYYEDLGTIYKILVASKRVCVVNQAYYCYFLGNEGAITKSWSLKKIEDLYSFYTEVYNRGISLHEKELSEIFYANGLVFLYMKIYEESFSKKKVSEKVKQALSNLHLPLQKMKDAPNYYKFIFYKLGVLPIIACINRYRLKGKK